MLARYRVDLRAALWGPGPVFVDAPDGVRGPAGVRWIASIVAPLQHDFDSAVAAAIDPQGLRDWTLQDELLAQAIEIIDVGNVNFEAAHLPKGAKARKPHRVPRPWARVRRQSTPEEIRAFFGKRKG